METLMPLNSEKYLQLTDDEIEHIDQYIYRFTKLQDTVGERLFKSVLQFVGEDINKLPFIDIFMKLVSLNITSNMNLWFELREIRNELAHDYDDNPELASEKINQIYNYKSSLIKYLEDIEKYIYNRTKK
jgi:hypothetical protein